MFVGIDIGGTLIRLAASNTLETPALRNRQEFRNSHFFEKNLKRITDYIDALRSTIAGIGIGIAGSLNDDKSMVLGTIYISEFNQKPLKKLLEEKYHCPVRLENDGVAAALGEALYGGGLRTDFIYLTWGTGIGRASVTFQNGRPQVTKLERRRYPYITDWENRCGGKNIQEHYQKPAEKLNEEQWQEITGVFVHYLAIFINDLKPKRIVLGGGIAVNQFARLRRVYSQLTKGQIKIAPPTIEVSKLGRDTGLYGALGSLR